MFMKTVCHPPLVQLAILFLSLFTELLWKKKKQIVIVLEKYRFKSDENPSWNKNKQTKNKL